jgi:hypothetical protein
MPFGEYDSFEDCVSKNQDKKNPEGYCASIEKKITGKWSAEESFRERLNVLKESFYRVGDCKKASMDYIRKNDNGNLELKELKNAFFGAAQTHYVVLDKKRNKIIDLTFSDYVEQLGKHPVLKPNDWMLKNKNKKEFDYSDYMNNYKGK